MTKGDGSFLSYSGFKGRFVVLALDQDCAFKNVKTLYGAFEDDLNVFEEETEAGGSAYALFNAGEKAEDCHIKLAPRQNRGFFIGNDIDKQVDMWYNLYNKSYS